MAKARPDQPLVPSVLDRLIDHDPTALTELPKSRFQRLRELKQSVRRDLENLLNTRVRCTSFPEDLTELDKSLVNYGIPDFNGVPLNSANDRQAFVAAIQAAIVRFEPRFKSLTVRLANDEERVDHKLHFQIDAMLYCEPAPEPVVFDSAVEPATGVFEVKGTP